MSLSRMEIVPCGDDALRILCGEGDIRHGLAAQLMSGPVWVEVVPGKQDLTVSFDPHTIGMAKASDRLAAEVAAAGIVETVTARHHVLDAVFGGDNGPDLAEIARRLAWTEDEIVSGIEASSLRVDMLGFTPGFAYVNGLDPALVAERLASPRTRVAAGSVGLITGHVGLYALDGPGGWPIVGRVIAPLFDKRAAEPFLLRPGDTISLRRATPPCA